MHFLRALVFSTVVYASAAFAATIRVGSCDEAIAKDIEIDIIEVYHEQPAEVSEQLVFPMINSPLNTHIHVIMCVYAFSKLHTSLSSYPHCRPGIKCVSNVQCQRHAGCGWCGPVETDFTVSLAT